MKATDYKKELIKAYYFGDISNEDFKNILDNYTKLVQEEMPNEWRFNDLQYFDTYLCDWFTFSGGDTKIRFKPKPDYTTEITALQGKAKENGMKAVVTFEKL